MDLLVDDLKIDDGAWHQCQSMQRDFGMLWKSIASDKAKKYQQGIKNSIRNFP
jgi:hypothetical protein